MQNDVDAAAPEPPVAFIKSRERRIALLLCLLAAIHVFIFSAAFPFFNNVDEGAHFDLALKYSRGCPPANLELISPDSAHYLALMNSLGYYRAQAAPPVWTETPERMQNDLAASQRHWQKLANYESSQTPLYYALAGAWWHLGHFLGLQDGRWLYWLRFLNIILVATTVWLAYVTAALVFPENSFLRLGVPAVLAGMPQTAFYSIGNDVMSPLCFGVTFFSLVKWLSAENPSWMEGGSTGLAFAATYLSKVTNLPLLGVAMVAIAFKTRQLCRQHKTQTAFITFLGCAAPPILAWMFWSYLHYGDVTGSKLNANFFGWTIKPFAQWWHHPIFTPSGFWTYLTGELGSFWQGEFWWSLKKMALPGTTSVYTLLSLGTLALASFEIFSESVHDSRRHALLLSLACFFASLGFFAALSTVYDYHDAPNPTMAHPFFSQGRLLLGALIPFLLLFNYGLNRALKRFPNRVKGLTLGMIILAMLALEIATDWPVFFNPYNWYHLP